MDHALCITTGSAIRIVQGSEHAQYSSILTLPLCNINSFNHISSKFKFPEMQHKYCYICPEIEKNVGKQM